MRNLTLRELLSHQLLKVPGILPSPIILRRFSPAKGDRPGGEARGWKWCSCTMACRNSHAWCQKVKTRVGHLPHIPIPEACCGCRGSSLASRLSGISLPLPKFGTQCDGTSAPPMAALPEETYLISMAVFTVIFVLHCCFY